MQLSSICNFAIKWAKLTFVLVCNQQVLCNYPVCNEVIWPELALPCWDASGQGRRFPWQDRYTVHLDMNIIQTLKHHNQHDKHRQIDIDRLFRTRDGPRNRKARVAHDIHECECVCAWHKNIVFAPKWLPCMNACMCAVFHCICICMCSLYSN